MKAITNANTAALLGGSMTLNEIIITGDSSLGMLLDLQD